MDSLIFVGLTEQEVETILSNPVTRVRVSSPMSGTTSSYLLRPRRPTPMDSHSQEPPRGSFLTLANPQDLQMRYSGSGPRDDSDNDASSPSGGVNGVGVQDATPPRVRVVRTQRTIFARSNLLNAGQLLGSYSPPPPPPYFPCPPPPPPVPADEVTVVCSVNRSPTPTTRSAAGVNETLVSVMECPVCFDISLPIWQCQNGHVICENCKDSLPTRNCPTCRISCAMITRNLALEKVLKTCSDLQISCKYSVNGCQLKMSYKDKVAHQMCCPFKSFACPLALTSENCRWEGTLDQIVPHLTGRHRSCHSIPLVYGTNESHGFPSQLPISPSRVYVGIKAQSCFDQIFLIALRITSFTKLDQYDNSEIGYEYGALVQCIGTNETAEQFAYRLELERDGGRLSWEAAPISIAKNIRATIESHDCFRFDRQTAELFENIDTDVLSLNVTINKK